MSEGYFYGLRCFSPYQGTVQVIQMPGFRAISDDGMTWRVQLLQRRSRVSSYGIWRADGSGSLKEFDHTQSIVEILRNHPPLPFPLADKLELWLLGAHDGLPLATLESTLSQASPPPVTQPVWHAALQGDSGFIAPSLIGASGRRDASTIHVTHAAVVSRWVQKGGGPQPRAQWFRRNETGNGVGLIGLRIDDSFVGRRLDRAEFPELLVREDWGSEQERALVRDYHDWQAPYLLAHDNLTRVTRDRLERAACRQAGRLYRVRKLLPEVLNPDLIKVAMVEAVIRRAATA